MSRYPVLIQNAPAIGSVVQYGAGTRVVEGLGKIFKSNENFPSIWGSQWLGHEWESVRYVYLADVAAAPVAPAPVAPIAVKFVERPFSKTYPTHDGLVGKGLNVAFHKFHLGMAKRTKESDDRTFLETFRLWFGHGATERKVDPSRRMKLAWMTAREAASRLGGSSRQYLGAALRAVYAAERTRTLSSSETIAAIRAAFIG